MSTAHSRDKETLEIDTDDPHDVLVAVTGSGSLPQFVDAIIAGNSWAKDEGNCPVSVLKRGRRSEETRRA